VSEVIADLEAGLGVRLLGRGSLGIESTVYGEASVVKVASVDAGS